MNTTDHTETHAPADGVRRATGRSRDEWFALLDAWGTQGRQYREIAAWLTGEHDLSKWWAQKLIVEYEQSRGLRSPGVRADGTFSVTVSKTVAVPVERLYEAFLDAERRGRWLPVVLHERTSQPNRSARFDCADGVTRVNVGFSAAGEAKSQVALEHERCRTPSPPTRRRRPGANISRRSRPCSRSERAPDASRHSWCQSRSSRPR